MRKEAKIFFMERYYKPKKKEKGKVKISNMKFSFTEQLDFADAFNDYKNSFEYKIDKSKSITELYIIHQAICKHFNCDFLDPFNISRKRRIIKLRQWFHYMARKHNPEYFMPLKEIGEYNSDITGRVFDHATVLHSTNKIIGYIERYKEESEIEKKLDELIKTIKESEIEKLKEAEQLKINRHDYAKRESKYAS